MRPIQHESSNGILTAPAGWNQNVHAIDAVPITRGTVGAHPVISTYWQPTREERDLIADGKGIVVHVLASVMPPVAVSVDGALGKP